MSKRRRVGTAVNNSPETEEKSDTKEYQMLSWISSQLKRLGDTNRAIVMAKYMKTTMPFYGVQARDRDPVIRGLKTRFIPQTRHEYEHGVRAIWALGHREEKYIAIAAARLYPKFAHSMESMPLFEHMIRTGQWWDFVDEISIHLIGSVVSEQPDEALALMDTWIDAEDMWIRRTAILCQNRMKQRTDTGRLFRYCLSCADETEFFIRKAIGWALREYAKTDMAAVARFVKTNSHKLSNLSVREATKHIPDRLWR